MRRTPGRRVRRHSCASWLPLVVSVSSSSAPASRWRPRRRTSVMMSLRTSGSPPVRRSLRTPLAMKARAEPVELLERQQVLLRQEGHVLRHAIDAAEVAAVGHRDAQIGDVPAERVDQGALLGHALYLAVYIGKVNQRLALLQAVCGWAGTWSAARRPAGRSRGGRRSRSRSSSATTPSSAAPTAAMPKATPKNRPEIIPTRPGMQVLREDQHG